MNNIPHEIGDEINLPNQDHPTLVEHNSIIEKERIIMNNNVLHPIVTQEIAPSSTPIDDPDVSSSDLSVSNESVAGTPLPNANMFQTHNLHVDKFVTHNNDQVGPHHANTNSSRDILFPITSVKDSVDSSVQDDDTDKLLQFLKTSKKENYNMAYRRELIMSFNSSKTKINPQQHFHESIVNNSLFDSLKKFYRKALTYRENSWRVDECAEIINKLWRLVQLQDEHKNQQSLEHTKDSRPVQSLRSFIKPCLDRIATDEEIVHRNTRKRNQFKTGNNVIQEGIVSKEGTKWTTRIEPHTCPKCNHTNVVSVRSVEDLVLEFSKLDSQYNEDLKQYENEVLAATYRIDGKKRKKIKKIDEPRKPSFPKQMMVCMCGVTKCKNIVDGRGCHHCNGLAKNNIQIPFNVKKAVCECALCKCDCNIEFAKTSWQSIATKVEQEKLHDMKNEKKSKGDGMYDVSLEFLSTL